MLQFIYFLSLQKYISRKDHYDYIDGLVQDCSNSIANAMELLQSCTKPLTGNNQIRKLPQLWIYLKVIDIIHLKFKS